MLPKKRSTRGRPPKKYSAAAVKNTTQKKSSTAPSAPANKDSSQDLSDILAKLIQASLLDSVRDISMNLRTLHHLRIALLGPWAAANHQY